MPGIDELIANLSSSEASERSRAAAWLYTQGCMLAESATRDWRDDPEFAALLTAPPTVGIAVTPENFQAILTVMGSPTLAEVPPDQDAQEFEVHLGDARLDILTTFEPGGAGPIARFLLKYGEGIQQVEYFVRDVDRATQILRTRFSVKPIYPETRAGAGSTRVNFFLATTPQGKNVLIELVEENLRPQK